MSKQLPPQPPHQRPGGQSWGQPPPQPPWQGAPPPQAPYSAPPGQQPYPPPYQQPYPPPPQYQQQYQPPGYYPPQAPPPKKGLPAIAIIGIVVGGLFVLLIVVGIIGTATGGNKGATATPKGPSSQVSSLSSTHDAPTSAVQQPTVTPLPIATRAPIAAVAIQPTPVAATATPALPASEPLKLVASGYGQTGNEVGVGFVVQNPDSVRALVDSQYQIAAYDSKGVVLKTDSGYIQLALPGQSLGIGRSLYLADGQTATKVDVQIHPGTPTTEKFPPAFTTEKVTIVPASAANYTSGRATGIVKSAASQAIKEIEVDTVIYDGAGTIIGGGFTFVDFVPAGGQAAVEMSLTYAGQPANAAMYGRLSGLSST